MNSLRQIYTRSQNKKISVKLKKLFQEYGGSLHNVNSTWCVSVWVKYPPPSTDNVRQVSSPTRAHVSPIWRQIQPCFFLSKTTTPPRRGHGARAEAALSARRMFRAAPDVWNHMARLETASNPAREQGIGQGKIPRALRTSCKEAHLIIAILMLKPTRKPSRITKLPRLTVTHTKYKDPSQLLQFHAISRIPRRDQQRPKETRFAAVGICVTQNQGWVSYWLPSAQSRKGCPRTNARMLHSIVISKLYQLV